MEKPSEKTPQAKLLASPSLEDFFTVDRANEGVIVPLELPGGVATDKWVKLRGVDSDVFRNAINEEARALRAIRDLPQDQQDAALEARKGRLTAILIMDWNFEQPCTIENVKLLLSKAPYLEFLLDAKAGDRALFTKAGLTSSMPSPGQTSSSPE